MNADKQSASVLACRWPAVVESANTHDFIHVSGEAALGEHHWCEGDRLIDSAGRVHVLSQGGREGLYWRPSPKLVCLPELNASLRRFAAGLGICCISKLTVRSAEEAVALVAWLEMQ
ncbi:DUF4144 family protein [Oceanimonas pelagia]|uniref:DUF4144 family protein n=1 Tax=Oceanimonas pelagia TaxID=3028314 RepID=A0AA50QAK1_9GAMM|nr:DUF4144 family protein [Oceanimonas pelagia]WMC09189.1 DUF4144 family protein [Oceanimonas pelagia]